LSFGGLRTTWVGLGVGFGVGLGVGFGVGFGVGCAVGRGVGLRVGCAVGRGVGLAVGRGVGLAVGAGVGCDVGRGVGSAVGRGVGAEVGRAVGAGVWTGRSVDAGRSLGTGVGRTVGVPVAIGARVGVAVAPGTSGLDAGVPDGLDDGGVSEAPGEPLGRAEGRPLPGGVVGDPVAVGGEVGGVGVGTTATGGGDGDVDRCVRPSPPAPSTIVASTRFRMPRLRTSRARWADVTSRSETPFRTGQGLDDGTRRHPPRAIRRADAGRPARTLRGLRP
jgi:hypothetical protein